MCVAMLIHLLLSNLRRKAIKTRPRIGKLIILCPVAGPVNLVEAMYGIWWYNLYKYYTYQLVRGPQPLELILLQLLNPPENMIKLIALFLGIIF